MDKRPHHRRAGIASLIGTTIEWYDFQIYGLSAAVVFNDVFFPQMSSAAGTMASFAVFAVGFIARPVGGLVFGHFGDRFGRRNVLLTTLLLTGASTFAMGLIPSYASIGILAPLLLVLMRLLGGIGLGGEWGGAVLLSVEHAPEGRRGFYGGLPQVGSPAGLLLATTVFTLTTALTGGHFGAWGWRVPFLLSAALVIVGLVIRATIPETPVFQQQPKAAIPSIPLARLLRDQPKTVLLSIGSFAVTSGGFYVYVTYMLSYGTKNLGIDKTTMTISGMMFAAGAIIGTLLVSTASDRLGRRPVFVAAAGFTIAYAFPLFALVGTRHELLIWIALGIGGLANGSLYGLMGSLTVEIFRPEARYTGASIGQQVSAGLLGGTTPLIVTAMVAQAGQVWPAPLWLAALAAISLLSVLALPETSREGLSSNVPRPATGSAGID